MDTLKATARTTGLLYLAIGIAGMLGFALIRPEIYIAGDPAATLANLTQSEGLARLGIGLEFVIVLAQALAAIWFFKLFRSVSATAAGSLAAFGLINAVAILSSAAFLVTALAVALDPALAPAGDAAATAQIDVRAERGVLGCRGTLLRALVDPDGISGPHLPLDAETPWLDTHRRRRRLRPQRLRGLPGS